MQGSIPESIALFVCLMLTISSGVYGQWFNLEVLKSYLNNNSHARITQPPRDLAVLDGEDALFFCGVEGNPTPTVSFFLDGQVGRLSSETGKVFTIPGGSLLRLFKVSTKQNGMKMECLASNHVGKDRASANLKVYKYTDDVPPGFPKFIRSPKSLSADVGKQAHMDCEAEGDPEVSFVWLKNGIPIRFPTGSARLNEHSMQPSRYTDYGYSDSLPKNSISVQFPLEFENLVSSDEAHYECLVFNKYGSILSSKVHLAVKNTFYPPTLLEKQEKVEVRPGKGANLTCTATGNPKPEVKWLTDQERPLTEATEGKAMLFLTDVTESRRYICMANNSLGRVQHKIRIEIIDVPPAPTDLECIDRGKTHASFRWFSGKPSQEHGTRMAVPVTSYTVILTDLDPSPPGSQGKRKITDISPWRINDDGSIHFKVTDLKPDKSYSVEVFAVSLKFGMSDASNTITFNTLEMPPGGPPLNIQATATTMDSVSVTWQVPLEPNGKITGYKLYYTMQLRSQLDRWQVVQTTQTHASLRNLVHGATYYIKVNAVNSAGDGPVSDAFPIIVMPGVPPQPVNFRGLSTSPTTIQIAWFPPELSHGMNILDYQLRCRRGSDKSTSPSHPSSPSNNVAALNPPLSIMIPAQHTLYVLEGLLPDTLYHISLAARTKHGLGLATQLDIRTLSNVPSAPRDLMLKSIRRESGASSEHSDMATEFIVLELTWKPPADTYGELKGYQVSFRLVGPPDLLHGEALGKQTTDRSIQTHAVRRNVTNTSYVSTQIDNIQFGRDYTFEVVAYNAIDIGVPTTFNVTTPENVPGSFPLHLRVRGLSATSVEVSWAPPPRESRNGRIIKYQVHYYEFSSSRNTAQYQNTTQPRLRIDGLQERTVYTFRVRAFTKLGPGPWSVSNTIRTTAELPDPPSQFKADRINQRQIKVTWNLPGQSSYRQESSNYRPVPVTGFRIHYAKHENVMDTSAGNILEVGAVTMATLDGLSPSESYIIRIKSRGTDKRYGNWSNPVIVNGDRYGLDTVGRGSYLNRVGDLRCFGMKSDSRSSSVEASLRVTWIPPSDKRLLKEYQIHVSGIKTFVNEMNEPVSLKLGPRKLTVMPSPFGNSLVDGSASGSRNEFLNDNTGNHLLHTIDKLEPNAVFDVELRPIYESGGNRAPTENEAVWERTSCRTKMMPPVNISAPVPIAFTARTNEVLVRLQRVSENLGPIRRYFLIVTTIERATLLTSPTKIDWHSELRRIPSNKEAETRVAAEFTQTAFDYPQLEIQVGGGSESGRSHQQSRRRRRLRQRRRRQSETGGWERFQQQSDGLGGNLVESKSNFDIYLYDCGLAKGQTYKALLLACIHSDTQYSVRLPKHGLGYSDSVYNGATDSTWSSSTSELVSDGSGGSSSSSNAVYEDEDSISPTYCSSSPWSVAFQANESLIVNVSPPRSGDKEIDGEGSLDSSQGGLPNGIGRASPSFFTIIVVTVIIGLALVALICIAVQCFFRRRPKQQRNSLGTKLTSGDNSLKTPLMSPTSHSAVVPGIDPVELRSVDFHNKDFVRNSMISLTASPVPIATLNNSRVNSPTPRSIKSVDNIQLPPPGRSPICLDKLAVHVSSLKAFDNNGLYTEYEAIDSGTGYTWQHANMELNKPKNRYANVIAYDHSRVLLNQFPGVPCSDYINANFIDGYRRQNAYIATQGPLPETFGDFWRMVWEQNSRIIVMMTKLEERARLKCDQYWPSRGTDFFYVTDDLAPSKQQDYCAMSVTLVDSTDYAYYTIRTLAIQQLAMETEEGVEKGASSYRASNIIDGLHPVSEARQIKQFQFTAWPDCGAPDQPQPLLLFIRHVTQTRNALLQQLTHQAQQTTQTHPHLENGLVPNALGGGKFGPTIVHCSAGVGRTGAFILIESQLERMHHENSLDIFGAVSRMRTQRNFMVQTEQQYTFLYDALVEAVQVMGSEVTAHSLYNYVMKLRAPAPTALLNQYLTSGGPKMGVGGGGELGNGTIKTNYIAPASSSITALELEFQRIFLNCQTLVPCTSAMLPENRNKNRVDFVLPYEINRVVLSQIRGIEGSDYINASFIDGYWSRQAYIATQAPLVNTVKDFWRMVWEHNSPIIVMLSPLVDGGGRELCYQYWPSERSQRYQHFLVEPMVEYNMPSFVLREFRLTDTQDGQSRTLRQFQFSDWPDSIPMSTAAEALIELISQVHKTQAQFGQDGPITVHCSSGAGRTGIFVALSILLERMRCEGMIDLLLTIRLLRMQRSQMIESEDQYAYCYTALLEYLASFEH